MTVLRLAGPASTTTSSIAPMPRGRSKLIKASNPSSASRAVLYGTVAEALPARLSKTGISSIGERLRNLRFGVANNAIETNGILSEVYLAGFAFLDTILEVPREWNQLLRGWTPYHIEEDDDPAVQQMNPVQKVGRTLFQNAKRMNWQMGIEEIFRGLTMGAFSLAIPALCILTARHGFYKNTVMEVPGHFLEAMKHQFSNHLVTENMAALAGREAEMLTNNPKKIKATLKSFVEGLFDYDAQKAELSFEAKPIDVRPIDSDGKRRAMETPKQTLREFLSGWAEDWANTAYEATTHKNEAATERLGLLGRCLTENLKQFHATHLEEGTLAGYDLSRVSLKLPQSMGLHKVPIATFADWLNHWKEFPLRVLSKPDKNATVSLQERTETVFNRLIKRKWLWNIGTTIFTALCLGKITMATQFGKRYSGYQPVEKTSHIPSQGLSGAFLQSSEEFTLPSRDFSTSGSLPTLQLKPSLSGSSSAKIPISNPPRKTRLEALK